MTAASVKKQSDSCKCKMLRNDVKLPDGFRYFYFRCSICGKVEYTPQELQHLMDYAKDHQFMFVSDWILAWLYAGEGTSLSGKTMLRKQIITVIYQFSHENHIPSEDPGFGSGKIDPYTVAVIRNIASLKDIGVVESRGMTDSEHRWLFLTEKGKAPGKEALDKLTPEQVKKLKEIKVLLHQLI